MVEQPAATASSWPPEQRAGPLESLSDVAITATIVAGLLDASPDGLVLVDAEGRLVLVNERTEELFGYSRGELLGRPIEVLLPESQRSVHVEHRHAYAQQPRLRPMGASMTLHGRRRDGSEFPVEISLNPLVAGDAQWTVAAVRDARARYAAEDLRDRAVAGVQGGISEELADTIVRGLFDVGLQLHGLIELSDGRVRDGLWAAVHRIDLSIREIRSTIFDMPRHAPDPP